VCFRERERNEKYGDPLFFHDKIKLKKRTEESGECAREREVGEQKERGGGE
jgi:hypothetical protein